MTMRRPRQHLLGNSVSFLVGTRHLSSSDYHHSREILIHRVACAIELSLKTFLQWRGRSDDRCRLEIRHDLTKALKAAAGLGFRPSHPDLPWLAAVLSPYYCHQRIGELAANVPALPSLQTAIHATEGLLSDIRASTRTRRSSSRP
ncbi:MAG TPA: hypothetical protein VKZ79_17695 [Alphaproteobacteria bacterium]|nr:hypothetical protein [Alphaproteobacteria bacterium]